MKTKTTSKPSKEAPRPPGIVGELAPRPDEKSTPYGGLLCPAEPRAKPAPAKGHGSGRIQKPVPGPDDRGFLALAVDPAPLVPHPHGHLQAGCTDWSDAGIEGGRDLLASPQGCRGQKGWGAGTQRKAGCFHSRSGARLSSEVSCRQESLCAFDRTVATSSSGTAAICITEVAFPCRWAEALIW
jgi:hypothetical protein